MHTLQYIPYSIITNIWHIYLFPGACTLSTQTFLRIDHVKAYTSYWYDLINFDVSPYQTTEKQQMLEMLSAVKDRDEAQDLDMAFRLSNDLLQAVATTVCSCDLVEALDGLLEYVQQHEHNDDLEVQQLGTWFAEMKTPTEFVFFWFGGMKTSWQRWNNLIWYLFGIKRFGGLFFVQLTTEPLGGWTMRWNKIPCFALLDPVMVVLKTTSSTAAGLLEAPKWSTSYRWIWCRWPVGGGGKSNNSNIFHVHSELLGKMKPFLTNMFVQIGFFNPPATV